ncbi:MAG: hypothetical protein GY844_10230 [Bradyrhizobium sp.]|nr:hypothetical protein [Bradyrhizobium sp.]
MEVGATKAASPGSGRAPPQQASEEDRSKDAFFEQVADVANAMIARHGNEFAIGTLVLAAKFIAEGKSLANQGNDNGDTAGAAKPG